MRNDEYALYIGQRFLKQLFDEPDVDLSDTKTIELQFPERWCNILEQRALYDAILYRCPNIQQIVIHTHSVYIIQCTRKENVFIMYNKNEVRYYEQPYTINVRYSSLTLAPGTSITGSVLL